MPLIILKSNPATAQDVVIFDTGVVVPSGGGTTTIEDVETIRDLSESEDLIELCRDEAFGVGSSTLILNDGQVDIEPDEVDEYLNGAFLLRDGPYGAVLRDEDGNLPFLTEPDHENFDTLAHGIVEDSYSVVSYDAFKRVSGIVVWQDVTQTVKIREKILTYQGLSRRIETLTVIQYDGNGVETYRIVTTYTYEGLRIINAETVRIP